MKTKFLLFIILIISGCRNIEDADSKKIEYTRDSLYADSIRIITADSVLKYIYSRSIGKINLPEKLPSDINECIYQLDTCTNDTLKIWMKLLTQHEFVSKSHFGFGMYLRNYWGLWGNNDLVKFFNKFEIFHPDDMSGIILECFHQKVKNKNFDFKAQVDSCLVYWRIIKEKEENKAKIEKLEFDKTKLFVDSLHKKIKYDSILKNIKNLKIDSLNFYKLDIKGDTQFLWTPGSSSRMDRKDYTNFIDFENFGKTNFFYYISDDGAIYNISLSLKRFIKRNDTLFFEDDETKNYFTPIFVPEMRRNLNYISNWKPKNNCSLFKSFINKYWIINGKYYMLELQGDCKGTPLKVRYFIDNQLNVIFDRNIINMFWQHKPLINKEE